MPFIKNTRLCCILAVIALFSLVFPGPRNLGATEYSLQDLFRISLEKSEKLKISEENFYISKQGQTRALSALLPTVSATGSYIRYDKDKYSDVGHALIQPESASSWGFTATESLSLSGREFTSYSASKDHVRKNEEDLFASREAYLLTVATAYYDVMKATKLLDISNSNVERLTTQRNAARTRLRVGEVTKTTLLRAEGELSGALADQVRAKNLLEYARANLARTVGIPNDFTLRETSFVDVEILPLERYQERALKERAELKSLELDRRIAEKKVSVARGAFWPDIALQGLYLKSDQSPQTVTLVDEYYAGAVLLNFPLFEGGLRVADLNEAKAKQRQSVLNYEDNIKSVNIEVQNAYLNLITQTGIYKSLEDQLTFARENNTAVTKQFEFGLASIIDVIDANNLLVTAERQLYDAVYTYQLAVLRLKRATGELLNEYLGQEQGKTGGAGS
ncbi:MAG TPA: TolC family protein [Syntrophales bacterium]|jgi:outer membrane protein|nr:TolC family protein [Syntrophales bacterium]HRT61368.1 TolC family protein [Syntrophales bacterium]